MQIIQLYIEGQRVDMFKDESISITQSIQNVKDIAKVFTDFSKTFSIPASKINNKIFKHYYNYDIQGGFDGRKKKDATIELNNITFREGKIKLEGVDLKNNLPHTYRITFFGNTVSLKDLLGEDKLSALTGMDDLTTAYNDSTVFSKLQLDPTTNDLIAPLITHTDRLVYDSGGNSYQGGSDEAQNLVRPGAGNQEGLHFNQLKYAVRVHRIIQAIEETYSLTFSDDFFVDTNTNYYNLFMWMHRKKGDVEALGGATLKIVDTFTGSLLPPDDSQTQMISATTLQVFADATNYDQFYLDVTTSTTFLTGYRVLIYKNGIENYRSDLLTSSTTITKSDFDLGVGKFTIYIESTEVATFSSIKWTVDYDPNETPKEYIASSYSFAPTFDFEISQQIPEIKVLDFLTGIFKMFNLTAFIKDDIVKVQMLDDFYSSGNTYDISKYVDVDKSSVNVALPYKEIVFKYKDTETILAKQHTQISGQEWAKENYNDSDDSLSGSVYKVELPFSHLKYERLINLNNNIYTTVQYGYFVDDNQDSYFGSPLLFYPILQSSANAINFIYANGTKVSTTNYNIPSNSIGISRFGDLDNINFKAEVNEYANSVFTDTLFKNYYQNYISSVFNSTNRLTKVSAYLPLRILFNYTLADRFVINGRSYKINTITSNLETGKSELELLNDL